MMVDTIQVAMVIPGEIDDVGFMQAGYEGLQRIEDEFDADTTCIDSIDTTTEALTAAAAELANDTPDLIIGHGGQCAGPIATTAEEYPDIKFAVTQGTVSSDNLTSYTIRQEESAWLAGATAGLLTETNVVGHISGIRVSPGLKSRAAFADGLNYTNEEAAFLTTFAGDQDDTQLAQAVTEAQIEQDADIIFTMLNSGRQGAIDAAKRDGGVDLIGNVRAWQHDYPESFVGSAVADVGTAAYHAARDVVNGVWQPNGVVEVGLENDDAVRLALAPSVSEPLAKQSEQLAQRIIADEIEVQTSYEGSEFTPEIVK